MDENVRMGLKDSRQWSIYTRLIAPISIAARIVQCVKLNASGFLELLCQREREREIERDIQE